MLCMGIFLLTLTICNCYINRVWDFYEAGKLSMALGAGLWILAAVLQIRTQFFELPVLQFHETAGKILRAFVCRAVSVEIFAQ